MEIIVVSVLIACAIGFFLYKSILFILFMIYRLPGDDLKWRQSPSLPMQEVGKRFKAKFSKNQKIHDKNKTIKEQEPLTTEIPMDILEESIKTSDFIKSKHGTDV